MSNVRCLVCGNTTWKKYDVRYNGYLGGCKSCQTQWKES